jgi:hypothetical protein
MRSRVALTRLPRRCCVSSAGVVSVLPGRSTDAVILRLLGVAVDFIPLK